mmetsp:Transcript_21077/g.50318  ORF Transcript_21077/g.50318 Transcript_21077/m.50318 type:complete len:109 (-) Transcript_21077:45-371(-)
MASGGGDLSARACARICESGPREGSASCRCVVKDELDSMLSNVELRSVPLLIFANKMDIPTSLSAVDIGSVLRIEDIKDRPINILPSNALTGEGLEKGIDWLADKMRM